MAYNKLEHFILEKKLADQLRYSTAEQRKYLYREVYGDFFRHFPELATNLETEESIRLNWQLKLLSRFFDSRKVILEIGAGDCLLSKALCQHFQTVIAYDVAETLPVLNKKPANLKCKIFNGLDIPEPDGIADIIYSNQVFEHLHPDDVHFTLQQCRRILSANGTLVIVTPHRFTGPHDVSRYFTDRPEGFHLKEYTYREIRELLRQNGYRNVSGCVGHKKWGYVKVPASILVAFEKLYGLLPGRLRYSLRETCLIKNFFGLKILARK